MTSTSEWRASAACRDVPDAEVFFPTAENGPIYVAQVAAAKSVCAGCRVRAECLDEAQIRIPYGIAGGLTPEERRDLRAGERREADDPGAAVAVIEAGLRPGASPKEVRQAGRVLLAAGRPVREVARRCGVAERTAARWATTSTTSNEVPAAVGGTGKGRGCSRALPLISHNTALAGTRATEGPRA
jgi:Transcription factor WhiB